MDVNLLSVDVREVVLTHPTIILLVVLIIIILLAYLLYTSNTYAGFWLRKKVTVRKTVGTNTCKIGSSILFVDDKEIPVAQSLRDDGWNVTVLRDADIDHEDVKRSDIIFVDWKGVGRKISSESQGMALAGNIKQKYGYRKYVILYSAREYTKPNGALCDDWISKGSDFSQYLDTINRGCHVLLK